MKWKKLGLLIDPERDLKTFKNTHAHMPMLERVEKNIYRCYFTTRNAENVSSVRYALFDLLKPNEIIEISDILYGPGKTGTFDDSGITPGCFVTNTDTEEEFFYYTGWNLTKKVPFNNSIGIAKKVGTEFFRIGDGPVMTRTLHEPYSCASPFVLYESGIYRMWYASMDSWSENKEGGHTHFYNLKYAESKDGINWKRDRTVVINYENDQEYAFGRPYVLKENNIYKMWYAYRGRSYKMGYAESEDGLKWTRKDQIVGISNSESGWDSEMIEYPYILKHNEDLYMFYNGNGYGESGIGVAILDS